MCKVSTAETKILVILCYYVLFSVVSLPYFALGLGNLDELINAIGQYFVCESTGSQMECNRFEFEQFTYPGVKTFELLAPLVSISSLVSTGEPPKISGGPFGLGGLDVFQGSM